MKSSVLARPAVLLPVALLACGAPTDGGSLPAVIERLSGSSARKADAPAPQPPPAPASRRDDASLPSVMTSRRYAGGRPISWWSERLTRLRREGPEDLYRLTLDRARLNGLEVAEGAGGEVTVTAAPAPAPGGRP